MSTYRSAKRDVAIADDYLANHLACRFCGGSAPRDDLATFGARCRSCYDAYLAEANPSWWPNRALTREERAAVMRKTRIGMKRIGQQSSNPRQWAHDLKARENAGERLSIALHLAWRSALGAHAVLDAVRGGLDAPTERITEALQTTGDIPWPDRDVVPAFDEEGA